MLQVCAMGSKIQCAEKVAHNNALDPTTLAVFEFQHSIRQPFTLNIVPNWEVRNRKEIFSDINPIHGIKARDSLKNYLVIDEISYVGECKSSAQNEIEIGSGSRVVGGGVEEFKGNF